MISKYRNRYVWVFDEACSSNSFETFQEAIVDFILYAMEALDAIADGESFK